jgi:flagellar hook-associated protein 2
LAAEGFSDDQKEEYKITSFTGTERFSSSTYMNQLKGQITHMVDYYGSISERFTATDGKALNKLGFADVSVQADGSVKVAGGANDSTNTNIPTGMALIEASDSVFKLNGATMTSSSTSLTVNGLTINFKNVTKPGEKVNFAVSNDVDGVYKSVKDFVTQYNAIVKEMNTLYNAENAKGYEPLSDEEKDKLSDSAIEKWEDKIKGALFKNDSTVEAILSGMRTALGSAVKVDGKTYSLASFGISTSTNYTEGGLLHIYGDSEDGTYAGYADKLKKALEENPDTVMQVLSQVGQNLYDTMSKKMASSQVSSALTFYNDKQIKNQLKDYTDQIDDWTKRLEDMEDNYYKQFTSMETAMAKLNSQTNSLSSMFSSK